MEFLNELTAGSIERKRFYIESFLDVLQSTLIKIEGCCTAKEWGKVYKYAHSINPQFHYVGAFATQKLIHEIELLSDEGIKIEELNLKIITLKQACKIITEQLQYELSVLR
ncbi:MAG: hypothetical protein IPP29_18750 [Bacteroidetes bacterium]|nr:hypothetical protein [Bacteroidota bacterium]